MRRLVLAIILAFGVGPVSAEEKEGGIVGTGVVGEVTGLEAFEVAGMRFNLPENIDLKGVRRVEDLRMGMTLSLRASRNGDGWQALRLRRIPVLIGPVTGPGEVMGARVLSDTAIGALPEDGVVIVDGFWSDRGVVATRITPTDGGLRQVTGRYDPTGFVGALPVRGDALAGVTPGEIVTASGRFADTSLTVVSLERGVFDGSVPDLLLAEGFFAAPEQSGEATLYSVDARLESQSALPSRDQRIRRCALRGVLDYDETALSIEDAKTIADFCISAIR